MRYQNGKQYEGVFNGIAVTFVLHNFSPAIADRFNHFLAEEGCLCTKKRNFASFMQKMNESSDKMYIFAAFS